MEKSEIKKLLEDSFPEKTPQAIQIMFLGYQRIQKELIKKLQQKKVSPEIIKIIEDYK